MRCWLAPEVVPLHHTLETFANGLASNIEVLSWNEMRSIELEADRQYSIL